MPVLTETTNKPKLQTLQTHKLLQSVPFRAMPQRPDKYNDKQHIMAYYHGMLFDEGIYGKPYQGPN